MMGAAATEGIAERQDRRYLGDKIKQSRDGRFNTIGIIDDLSSAAARYLQTTMPAKLAMG